MRCASLPFCLDCAIVVRVAMHTLDIIVWPAARRAFHAYLSATARLRMFGYHALPAWFDYPDTLAHAFAAFCGCVLNRRTFCRDRHHSLRDLWIIILAVYHARTRGFLCSFLRLRIIGSLVPRLLRCARFARVHVLRAARLPRCVRVTPRVICQHVTHRCVRCCAHGGLRRVIFLYAYCVALPRDAFDTSNVLRSAPRRLSWLPASAVTCSPRVTLHCRLALRAALR